MKKTLLSLLTLCFWCAANAETISKEEALQIVKEFTTPTFAKGRNRIMSNKTFVHKALPEMLLIDEMEPFYIFTGDNSFYIVSSETEYGDIIAYSEEASFEIDNMPPSLQYLLNYYKSQIKYIKDNNAKSNLHKATSFSSSKLLKTANFGQNGLFWWNDCPKINGQKTYAGCGAAAIAIVMKYHNWPDVGEGSNSVSVNGSKYSVDFSKQSYNWSIIPTSSPYDEQWSDAAKNEASKILYHCGVASSSEYGTSGTSTSSLEIGPALKNHFKYNVAENKMGISGYYTEIRSLYSDDAWNQMLKKEIDNDRPCILMGSSASSTHIFVCDGYNTSGLFHFNLGWSGTGNGYYSMSSVNGEYDVSFAIVGISPNGKPTDQPSGGDEDTPSQSIDGHEYVDLGLPSGKLWATTNYGASSPQAYGTYLDFSDVGNVTKNWGSKWTTPTYSDAKELVTKCSWSETTQNGKSGYLVTGPNGNSIFIPCAGWKIMGDSNQVGKLAILWTSTASDNSFSFAIYANGGSANYSNTFNTSLLSAPVRPITTITINDIKPTEIKVSSISLSQTTLTLKVGETSTLTATVSPSNATNKDVKCTVSDTNVITYSDGVVKGTGEGVATITITAADGSGVSASCTVTVESGNEGPSGFSGHEYVDLGLPSGTLWATTNVGADSPEEYGDYYAWGETKTKSNYEWSTYKYCDGTDQQMTKYTSKGEVLSPSDDAATANWGEDWRMPTVKEMNNLRNYCKWTYTSIKGVSGYKVEGDNGNYIFLPTAGMMLYGWHTNTSQGRYWTSSLSTTDTTYGSYLLFDESSYSWYMVNRSYGHSVRPVYQGVVDNIEECITSEESEPAEYYNINGIKTNGMVRGLNVVRLKNGKVIKMINK